MNVAIESLAKILHESGREAVARGLVYRNDLPIRPFCEWDELSEDAKEGRRIMARYLVRMRGTVSALLAGVGDA